MFPDILCAISVFCELVTLLFFFRLYTNTIRLPLLFEFAPLIFICLLVFLCRQTSFIQANWAKSWETWNMAVAGCPDYFLHHPKYQVTLNFLWGTSGTFYLKHFIGSRNNTRAQFLSGEHGPHALQSHKNLMRMFYPEVVVKFEPFACTSRPPVYLYIYTNNKLTKMHSRLHGFADK